MGVEYGCLGALGNNRVQLEISQTSAIMTVMPVISHKTLFYSLSTYGVNLDEFMFLSNQPRDSKHHIRVEMLPIHLKDTVCALTSTHLS